MVRSIDTADDSLSAALNQIGVAQDRVIKLASGDGITAANFEYSDLIQGRHAGAVKAVIEKDGSPLLYIAKDKTHSFENERALASLLANRGETALLLALPSTQTRNSTSRVWHCSLDRPSCQEVDLSNQLDARAILGDLQGGMWADPTFGYQEQRLRNLLVTSVRHVAGALRQLSGLKDDDADQLEVLGLIGRSLFTRFLVDRGILSKAGAPALWRILDGDGAAAFASPTQAAATCEWLDVTFNGEFMPLPLNGRTYKTYFSALQRHSKKALEPLGWIMNRTDAHGQMPLWELLDFSHIPVGTLSEVYEDYAHHRSPEKAKETSVHFTPRHIARMMVRQAFAGLEEGTAASARLLDPATGAAVFLGLGFRELARQHALAHGEWPDTKQLRSILYTQLRGMDINPSALNLAALTLYLSAIELDNNPTPPEKLKFEKKLLGNVLFDVADNDPEDHAASSLGSLRAISPAGKNFDVVIGNPPWTSQKGANGFEQALTKETESVARKLLAERAPQLKTSYKHPDKVPDLAFAWKSTQWAREGGVIALVMHQRLLVKQSEGWSAARQALFSCIEVDGILNAGEFADDNTLLWPGIDSPFCILFGRNRAPSRDQRTVILTPTIEPSLLARRQLRLDPNATVSIKLGQLEEQPNPISSLAKGCELDLVFLQRCISRVEEKDSKRRSPIFGDARSLPMSTLGECLNAIAEEPPARGMKKGSLVSNKTVLRTPTWYDDLPDDVSELSAKGRYLGMIDGQPFLVPFEKRPVRSTPPLSYFKAPLSLLLREAPGDRNTPARAFLLKPPRGGKVPVIYPFSFIGVPLKKGKDSELAAKYICLWINSSFYSYFHTLTSSRFAYGRRVINDDEIFGMPIISPSIAMEAGLTNERQINNLFDSLSNSANRAEYSIDDWVKSIAGFNHEECALMEDTLSVSYPIGDSTKSGRYWVDSKTVNKYLNCLRDEMADTAPDAININTLNTINDFSPSMAGWRFLTWQCLDGAVCSNAHVIEGRDEESLMRLVRDEYPSGQVWATTKDGWHIFGQIALRRLWLPSRAPLLASMIIAWSDQE